MVSKKQIRVFTRSEHIKRTLKGADFKAYNLSFCSSLERITQNIDKIQIVLIEIHQEASFHEFANKLNKAHWPHGLYQTPILLLLSSRLKYLYVKMQSVYKSNIQDIFLYGGLQKKHNPAFIFCLTLFLKRNIHLLQKKMENEWLQKENRSLLASIHKPLNNPHNINITVSSCLIGNSQAMKKVRRTLKQVKNKNSFILLISQIGLEQEEKDILKYLNHSLKVTSKQSVTINFTNIPEKLHHIAIWGNKDDTNSTVVSVQNFYHGTLVLKNIDALSWDNQTSLLHAIEHRENILRKGSQDKFCHLVFINRETIDVLVEKGLFRQNLFSKISHHKIHIPSLKDRENDMIQIAENYIQNYNQVFHKDIYLSLFLKKEMLLFDWRSNTAQLYDFLYQYCTFSENTPDKLATLRFVQSHCHSNINDLNNQLLRNIHKKQTPNLFSQDTIEGKWHPRLSNLEQSYIQLVLESHKNNISQTARILGISRKTLYQKIQLYNIKTKKSA